MFRASGSAVHQSAEVFLVPTAFERHVERDATAAHELHQRHVHRDHAVAAARLEYRVDLVGFAFTDEVAHGGSPDHDLARDRATLTIAGRNELLGADPLERGCE